MRPQPCEGSAGLAKNDGTSALGLTANDWGRGGCAANESSELDLLRDQTDLAINRLVASPNQLVCGPVQTKGTQ